MKLIKLLTVPAMFLFSLLMAVPALADAATIEAQFSCTAVGKVCFNLIVSTRDFPTEGRDVTLTLQGHKVGDAAGTLTTISSSFTEGSSSTVLTQLHLDNNLDNATLTICFANVTTANFDSFVLRVAAVGPEFTVNGKESVDLGPFTNNCPTPAPPPSPMTPTPMTPTPTANTTAVLAQTGGFDFRFPLIGLAVILAGLALFLVSASRTRRSAGQK